MDAGVATRTGAIGTVVETTVERYEIRAEKPSYKAVNRKPGIAKGESGFIGDRL
jgi:hypothetical protein